jgi:hypothetical protein
LGIGDWGLGPIPNPQSPIPNPPNPHLIIIHDIKTFKIKLIIKLNNKFKIYKYIYKWIVHN